MMRNRTQHWWQQAEQHCENFLQATAQLNTYTPPDGIQALVETMRDEAAAVEAIPYSEPCAAARGSLLDAMQAMIEGFEKALTGDFGGADVHIAHAHRALSSFADLMGERVA